METQISVLGREEDVLRRSSIKQPSWLSKVCCVHSFSFSLALRFRSPGVLETWRRRKLQVDNMVAQSLACCGRSLKRCERPGRAWGVGGAARGSEKQGPEICWWWRRWLWGGGLLKAPIGKRKIKTDKTKPWEEYERYRNKWTGE